MRNTKIWEILKYDKYSVLFTLPNGKKYRFQPGCSWLVLPSLVGVFLHNICQQQNLSGSQQQKPFPPALWPLRNVQSLKTGGSITFEAGLWSSAPVTGRGAHRRKGQVTPGKVTRQCQRELLPQLLSWCSSLHPVWDKTLLPPWTDAAVSPASTFLILLKHNFIFLLIKSTKVAAAGSKLSYSQHCPSLPSFSKT